MEQSCFFLEQYCFFFEVYKPWSSSFPSPPAIRDYDEALQINPELKRAKEGKSKAQKVQKQSEKRDYYKILGVGRSAKKQEIVKAYRCVNGFYKV